ncbi:MAG TPA: LamG domain-containing protein, partial [Candidatus Limnocylindria bacterium]|nr:LamG domain-containing protein [Candidatus Limnocylindria bacterium]
LVTVPHSASLNALPLTIMAWLNTTQSTGSFPGIISKYEGGQSRGYALGMANGRFDPWYYADPGNHVQELSGPELDGRFVADGLWHHVAYVVGTDAAQIYIDGVLVNDLPWLGTAAATTTESPLLFGAYRGGSALPYDGLLEEVSIWNRALPEEEIRALMYHPAKGTENGLQGLWHFNETEGTTAADSSGSGNDGSLSGPVSRVISTAPLH